MAPLEVGKANDRVTFRYFKGPETDLPCVFHSLYEIYFFIGGTVEFVCDDTREKLQPFDVVIIPAGEYHRFVVGDGGEDYERCVLSVDASLLGEALTNESFGDKRILRLNKNHRIIKHLLYLKEACETRSQEDFSVILAAVTTDLILLIKQSENFQDFEKSGGLQKLSVDIMNYINNNYKSTITLQQIAETFFVSVSTACHYFKEDYGISIKQYIIEKKMCEANFLIEKGLKSREVCDILGFDNYSTFFRAYKKRFGLSPKGKK